MRKYLCRRILPAAVTICLIFTGCNKENAETPDIVSSVTEKPTTETTSGTVPETTSESAGYETQITGSEAETESKSYEPYQIKLYNSMGTGMPRPDDYGEDFTRYTVNGDLDDILLLLKDKNVSDKIETEVNIWLNYLGTNYNYSQEQLSDNKYFYTACTAYNGFLFYGKEVRNTDTGYYTVFDLRTGERMGLSDMFFAGEQFIDNLNTKLWNEMQKLTNISPIDYEPIEYLPMKREFYGLTENEFYFNTRRFYFPDNNPYFIESEQINIDIFDFDTVLNVPYDMTGLFMDGADEQLDFGSKNYDYTTNFYLQKGNINVYQLNKSPKLTEKQRDFLNRIALSMSSDEFLENISDKGWGVYSKDDSLVYCTNKDRDGNEYVSLNIHIFDINIEIINDDFAKIRFYQSDAWEEPAPSYCLYFDIDTLEQLDTKQLFERVFDDNEYVWSNTGETPDINLIKSEDINAGSSNMYYYGKSDDGFLYGYISKKSDQYQYR